MSRPTVAPLGVAIAFALAFPALAQDAPAGRATDLDDVIVTGTRPKM